VSDDASVSGGGSKRAGELPAASVVADEEDAAVGYYEEDDGNHSGSSPQPVSPPARAGAGAGWHGGRGLARMASSPVLRPGAAGAAAAVGFFPPSTATSLEENRGDAFAFSNEALAEVPFHREYRGGMRAAIIEGPGIYYIGIIDICQRYSWAKWLERMMKIYGACRNGNGISAMPPDAYAARFNERVVAQLLEYDVRPLDA